MTIPELTIAIPTRNRRAMLAEALESALAQEFRNIEIVVSDNASQDDTGRYLADLRDGRLRVFRQEKLLSMHENWNFCLEKAGGRLFLLLSDDDILLSGAVGTLVKAFADSRVKLAYGGVIYFNDTTRMLGHGLEAPEIETGREFIINSLKARRQALPSITMHYTGTARDMGGYPEIGNSTDLALRLSLAAAGLVFFNKGPLLKYRLHPGSLTGDTDKTIESFELLNAWAAVPGGPLNSWADDVRLYCADALSARAVASALRGKKDAAYKFAASAAVFNGKAWYYRFIVCLCSSWPVRLLGAARRGLLSGSWRKRT